MKIAEHIYYRKGSCCTYLIDDGTLIDPGFIDFDAILEMLVEASVPPSKLKSLVLTHSHRDHAGLAAVIKRNTAVKVYAHRKKGNNILQSGIYANLDNVVDEYVEEGDIMPILGGAKVLYTPGHTSDHIGLYLMKEKILFSGDALQIKNGKLCMAPKGLNYDNKIARESFERLIKLDYRILCPGHREPKFTGQNPQ